jgi:hypothetical protein
MKKLLFVLLVLLVGTAAMYADGSITTTNDKSFEVVTEQSGDIVLKMDSSIVLSPRDRDRFLTYLKAHSECMSKFASESIKISNTFYTGTMLLGAKDQFRFTMYTNVIKDNPYALVINLYEYSEKVSSYTFDINKLNELITLIESTQVNTDEYLKQNFRVRSLANQIKDLMLK